MTMSRVKTINRVTNEGVLARHKSQRDVLDMAELDRLRIKLNNILEYIIQSSVSSARMG